MTALINKGNSVNVSVTVTIKDRVKDFRRVPASELHPNPKNWRTHPTAQRDALRGILAEVGWADAVLARELPDGSLMLIDGHLRTETMTGEQVPVLVLDVTEQEADTLLLLLDPLSGMAGTDAPLLDALLRDVQTGSEPLAQMYEDLAADAGLYKAVADQKADEEKPSADGHGCVCPRCGCEAAPIENEVDA